MLHLSGHTFMTPVFLLAEDGFNLVLVEKPEFSCIQIPKLKLAVGKPFQLYDRMADCLEHLADLSLPSLMDGNFYAGRARPGFNDFNGCRPGQ